MRPDGESPARTPDEVGVVVGDADVVDAAPLARVPDRLHCCRAAVLQQQPVALGQAIRFRPDAVAEERMLGRGPDRPARDPQLPQQPLADEHLLHRFIFRRRLRGKLVPTQNQVAHDQLVDPHRSRHRADRRVARETDLEPEEVAYPRRRVVEPTNNAAERDVRHAVC